MALDLDEAERLRGALPLITDRRVVLREAWRNAPADVRRRFLTEVIAALCAAHGGADG